MDSMAMGRPKDARANILASDDQSLATFSTCRTNTVASGAGIIQNLMRSFALKMMTIRETTQCVVDMVGAFQCA